MPVVVGAVGWRCILQGSAVTPQMFGAVGDGTTDDTAALEAMLTSGYKRFDFGTSTYLATITPGVPLAMFTGVDGIEIVGCGAKIYVPGMYSDVLNARVFAFVRCKNVRVVGVNYLGNASVSQDVTTPGDGAPNVGATYIDCGNACSNVVVDCEISHARYGVQANVESYMTPQGGTELCDHFKIRLKTHNCGYPAALCWVDDIDVLVNATTVKRAIYLAGCKGGKAVAYFKDEASYEDVFVLLTDANATVDGQGRSTSSRGCEDLHVEAYDMGSTIFKANSWCCGLSLNFVNPGTVFRNLDFRFKVKGTDAIASSLGGFLCNSECKAIQTHYPFNWEPGVALENITVCGVVDRSSQGFVAGHAYGEVYVQTFDDDDNFDTTTHFATVKNFVVEGVLVKPSTLAHTVLRFRIPQPGDGSKISGCDLGTTDAALICLQTRTVPLLIENSALNYYNSGGSLPKAVHRLVNCKTNVARNQAISGVATLVAGTVTVTSDIVQANEVIKVTRLTWGGAQGWIVPRNIIANTSFDLQSTNGADDGQVLWEFVRGAQGGGQ